MYALCVSGTVNTQGFVWKVFMRYIYIFIRSLFVVLNFSAHHRKERRTLRESDFLSFH